MDSHSRRQGQKNLQLQTTAGNLNWKIPKRIHSMEDEKPNVKNGVQSNEKQRRASAPASTPCRSQYNAKQQKNGMERRASVTSSDEKPRIKRFSGSNIDSEPVVKPKKKPPHKDPNVVGYSSRGGIHRHQHQLEREIAYDEYRGRVVRRTRRDSSDEYPEWADNDYWRK